jgi:hypothetical protein
MSVLGNYVFKLEMIYTRFLLIEDFPFIQNFSSEIETKKTASL